LRGGEPGLEPAFNGVMIGMNIGGLGEFHNNQGDLPKFRQPGYFFRGLLGLLGGENHSNCFKALWV